MNIPKEYHSIILNEFKNITIQCNKVDLIEDKLYFFSASYGVLNRIMNIYTDPILIFMHQILQSVHQGLTNRLSQNQILHNVSNSFPVIFVDTLLIYFSELTKAFEENNDNNIREILEKFSNLWYATSGNGFYLFLNDKIKF